MKEKNNLHTYSLPELPHLKIHGRTTPNRSPLTLFWTGSALELNVQATELWVEIEADYEMYEPWISIVINDASVSRQMVTAGRHWIPVFRGMNAKTVKNVRIVSEVQAMSGDPGRLLQVHAVKTDGKFKPVQDKPYKIEFIGDSITSGEGVIGAKEEADWIPMWFSAVHNYTAMTARALNAEHRVLSQSGWGVLTSWDNNPQANLPRYYEQVCGLLSGERNEALGAKGPHDFAAWQPDAVVVNLGTNDDGAFHNPEWRDPASGRVYKQRLNEDGSYNADDLAAFEQAACEFLITLRKNNKHAHIVWAYGMIGIPLMPAIYRAVDAYVKQTGDRNVSVFQMPNMTGETIGARSHPGVLAHEQAAEALAGYLKGILG
ncbi:SGNH/GDSL hydrolase family protein [Paenibacillus sp. NFR01]|uniref:SGNH/GDSL hydrolase family protein n=1 Tax=Paenibacillus sp. NFR01 TaxID=1566279 RepID=UPI0008D10A54|nr:SGNH/GDSL hydrolase family protein [Paenibacillus sp. NFR01]SEU09798.1 GDSL-like Lipase/Acylhydrolase family protein [Paenibacillus sp. NFR01]